MVRYDTVQVTPSFINPSKLMHTPNSCTELGQCKLSHLGTVYTVASLPTKKRPATWRQAPCSC